MKTIYYIAVAGLVASAIAHFSTFLGVNPQKALPGVWVLHALIFVVWIPVVLLGRQARKRDSANSLWASLGAKAPAWMKALGAVFFAYAFLNFFYAMFVLNEGGVPGEVDGKKVIHNHGEVIRELTDEEYELHRAHTMRMFSGHWLVFYGVGVVVLHSELKRRRIQAESRGIPGWCRK